MMRASGMTAGKIGITPMTPNTAAGVLERRFPAIRSAATTTMYAMARRP